MSLLSPFFGWVLLFSLTNSLSEELIFRVGIAEALHEIVSPVTLMLVSAMLFGLAHYGGMPNGIVGMLMSGLLGWLLMKSLLETHGIFWAWFIHFLQDVVIFSALTILNTKSNTPLTPNYPAALITVAIASHDVPLSPKQLVTQHSGYSCCLA